MKFHEQADGRARLVLTSSCVEWFIRRMIAVGEGEAKLLHLFETTGWSVNPPPSPLPIKENSGRRPTLRDAHEAELLAAAACEVSRFDPRSWPAMR